MKHLPEWLARGYAGEMCYLEDPRRADPARVLAGARNLMVVALNYNSAQPAFDMTRGNVVDDDSARGGFRAMPGVTIITRY